MFLISLNSELKVLHLKKIVLHTLDIMKEKLPHKRPLHLISAYVVEPGDSTSFVCAACETF